MRDTYKISPLIKNHTTKHPESEHEVEGESNDCAVEVNLQEQVQKMSDLSTFPFVSTTNNHWKYLPFMLALVPFVFH